MSRPPTPVLVVLVALAPSGCGPPAENPEFDDATAFLFREFETELPERLAYALRGLEAQLYGTVDVEAASAIDRELIPATLSEEDLEGIGTPPLPPEQAVPVAVPRTSPFAVDEHALIPLLPDQVPVEPNSPDRYDRTFLDGTDACWPDRGCPVLRTDNDLERRNIAVQIPYRQFKDFRWADLALPDPADVPAGQEATPEGESRWAILARSWIED